jgi:predicted Zn-dependent peptidase
VLREFYKERDVVMEERRMNYESQPIGRLLEEFVGLAYKAHSYGHFGIGHMSDLEGLTRGEAWAFYRRHYIANNMTTAVVGDVDAGEVIRLAQEYFSQLPTGPDPPPVETVEPPQLGERRVVIEDPSQPLVVIGYHKPDARHPDSAVFDAIMDIVGVGRTSRLYKSLVKEKKIALQVGAFPGFPGDKYPNLFVFYAFPTRGHTAEEMEEAIDAEIERIKTELVSEEELRGVKTRTKANFIRSLRSNSGMAEQLTFYEEITGDWRHLFKVVEEIHAVTAEDIQRVANQYFQKGNRTVGMLVTKG